MTISTQDNTFSYTGNGATTAFSFPRLFYADSDLVVTVDGVTKTITTHYTVSGAGNANGGTVTFVTAPASSTAVIIQRVVSYVQETDFENFDGNPADVTEEQMDLLAMMAQQLKEITDRSVKFPVGDNARVTLPNVATRASTYLGFDANGDLASLDSVTGATAASTYIINNVITAASEAALKAAINAEAGVDFQAYDANTSKLNLAQEYTKTQNFNATVLTDAATISWDLSLNQVASVTLGGNRTLGAPTNMVDGATYILTIKQDATGSRTLAYNSAYKFPSGTAPVLSTAASAVDIITFICNGTNMYGVAQKAFA
jgi:hypothetical protein